MGQSTEALSACLTEGDILRARELLEASAPGAPIQLELLAGLLESANDETLFDHALRLTKSLLEQCRGRAAKREGLQHATRAFSVTLDSREPLIRLAGIEALWLPVEDQPNDLVEAAATKVSLLRPHSPALIALGSLLGDSDADRVHFGVSGLDIARQTAGSGQLRDRARVILRGEGKDLARSTLQAAIDDEPDLREEYEPALRMLA